MSGVTVGLYVPPDRATLLRLEPALAACGHLEVVPETTWAPGGGPNTFARVAEELSQRLGVPLVGHGVGFDLGSTDPRDDDHRARWLARLAETQERLRFAWFTDHGGSTRIGGHPILLPVAPPRTRATRDAGRRALDRLASVFGTVGVENSVFYAPFDPPETEPGFLAATIGRAHHLLLDLHNLVCDEENHGIDALDWLSRAPLDRVIEVHLAGGSAGETLGAARPFRLDSHDHRVPERVWVLLAAVLPRLPALRAVTLERLEGTVGEGEGDEVLADLLRARAAVEAAGPAREAPVGPPAAPLPEVGDAEHAALDAVLAEAWRAPRPADVLGRRRSEVPGPLRAGVDRALADPAGLHLTARLILQLRFSRVLQGSQAASAWFDADPAAFVRVFGAFHRQVAPDDDPFADAAAFDRFGGPPPG